MSGPTDPWEATVTVRPKSARLGGALERALWPESAREVPRARAHLGRGPDDAIVLTIVARDTGAMRAALNTYLGWVHLALATARTIDRSPSAPPVR